MKITEQNYIDYELITNLQTNLDLMDIDLQLGRDGKDFTAKMNGLGIIAESIPSLVEKCYQTIIYAGEI